MTARVLNLSAQAAYQVPIWLINHSQPHSQRCAQIPGDGKHQAGRDWRLKAKGSDAARRSSDRRLQEGKPNNVRLGDQEPAAIGRNL